MPVAGEVPICLTDSERARFWRYVAKADGDQCWLWRGCLRYKGYGSFDVYQTGDGRCRRLKAHRVAWAIENGDPGQACVLHNCDTPACVRPDHLKIGDHLENMRDMVARGRSQVGDRNVSRLYPERVARGEQKGKLHDGDVIEIRRRLAEGKRGTAAQLAREYGVTHGTIRFIRYGMTWRHLSDPPMRPAP